MKKLSLVCATLLAGVSLAGCGNTTSQKQSNNSSSSQPAKVVKHHKESKQKTSKNSTSISINSTSASSASSQTTASSQGEVDKTDPSTWDNPYKGYPSYRAYCEANHGDPEVQAQTAKMQHDWNVQQGIENPDGSEKANNNNNQVIRDYYDGDMHIVDTPNSETVTVTETYPGDNTSEGGDAQ